MVGLSCSAGRFPDLLVEHKKCLKSRFQGWAPGTQHISCFEDFRGNTWG